MPTPPKPFTVLTTEKKSHRTKAELKQRQQAEEALSTGVALKERPEVKNNPIAHKEFKRLNELLKTIGKNDAIYEGIINRYCMIYAECIEFEEKRERFYQQFDDLEDKADDMEYKDYFKLQTEMQKNILGIDKQIQSKRKMLLDIEKENIMTIAAALRSIPKKPENKKNALLEALGGD
jgi:phage terminase small subunit